MCNIFHHGPELVLGINPPAEDHLTPAFYRFQCLKRLDGVPWAQFWRKGMCKQVAPYTVYNSDCYGGLAWFSNACLVYLLQYPELHCTPQVWAGASGENAAQAFCGTGEVGAVLRILHPERGTQAIPHHS